MNKLKNKKDEYSQRLFPVDDQRACFKIAWGPAARDFGWGQGGEA